MNLDRFKRSPSVTVDPTQSFYYVEISMTRVAANELSESDPVAVGVAASELMPEPESEAASQYVANPVNQTASDVITETSEWERSVMLALAASGISLLTPSPEFLGVSLS